MTLEEFSNTFDTLVNSYGVLKYPGQVFSFDEYEKSVFLTQAQEQIVIELYTGRNTKNSAFEVTEELRSNLRNLVRTAVLTESTKEYKGLSEYSKFFDLPDPNDVLFITYEYATLNDESAKCFNGKTIDVIPVTQDEFQRTMKNPFKQANKRRALRLDNYDNTLEVVSKYNIKDYTIRYLSKPSPIILANLDGLTIDGEPNISKCKLDSVLHRTIVERAVLMAISTRGSQNNS